MVWTAGNIVWVGYSQYSMGELLAIEYGRKAGNRVWMDGLAMMYGWTVAIAYGWNAGKNHVDCLQKSKVVCGHESIG